MSDVIEIRGCIGCKGDQCETCAGEVGISPAEIAAAIEKAKEVFGQLKSAWEWMTKPGGPIDFLEGGPKKRTRRRRRARQLKLASWCFAVLLARDPELFFTNKKKFRKKLIKLINSPIQVPDSDVKGPTVFPKVATWGLWKKTELTGDFMTQLKKFFVSTLEGRETFDALKREYSPKYKTRPAARATAVVRPAPSSREESRARDEADAREAREAREKAKKKRRKKKAREKKRRQKEKEARKVAKKKKRGNKKARRERESVMVPSALAVDIEDRKRVVLNKIKKLFREGKTATARAAAKRLARV